MSSNLIGGPVLFPTAAKRADLITLTLRAMELGQDEFQVRLCEDGFPRFSGEGYPFRTEEPQSRALTLLAQEECGVIEGAGPKDPEIYWFEPPLATYPMITVWVRDSAMLYHTYTDQVEAFARRWLQLCEQGQAVFGYISPFEDMLYRDYLEEHIVPALQQGKLSELMGTDINWLIYLGPDLARRWRQEQTSFPTLPLVSQELPSGAHFFRTRTEVLA